MAEYANYNPYANQNQNPFSANPNPNPPPYPNQPRPPPGASPTAYQQPFAPQAQPNYQGWHQQPPQPQFAAAPPPQAPMCTCPNPMQAVERTVQKAGATQGQKFWACAVGDKSRGGCGFFEWQDAKLKAESDAKRQKSSQPRGPDPILVSLMQQVAAMNQKLDQILGMMTGNLNSKPLSVEEALGGEGVGRGN